jgi:hypothetical protein
LLEPLARRLGGAHVGAHRDVHADIACRTGQDRADEVADAGLQTEQESQDDEDDGANNRDRPVLPVQIGARTLLDGTGDLLHALAARAGRQDDARCPNAVTESQEPACEYKDQQRRHFVFLYFPLARNQPAPVLRIAPSPDRPTAATIRHCAGPKRCAWQAAREAAPERRAENARPARLWQGVCWLLRRPHRDGRRSRP